MPKLYLNDGVVTSNTANIETVIWEYTVPRGYVYELTTTPLYMFFSSRDTFTGDGKTTDFVLSGNLVKPEKLPDNMGAVYVYVDGTLQTSGITVNYATNTVSFSVAPAAKSVIEIYYLFGNGNLKVYCYSPEENRKLILWNGRIENFQIADQFDAKTAQRLKNIAPLAQDFKIKILLKSPTVIASGSAQLAKAANFIIEIPYNEYPIEKYPSEALKKFVDSMI